VKSICIPDDKGWAENLKTALSKIPHSRILYLQEDYFLERPVDTAFIEALLETMINENAAYLRLYPAPKPKITWDKNIGIIRKSDPYRTSLQAAFWDKKILDWLLIYGEAGVPFEKDGSVRSAKIDRLFLCVKKPVFDYLSTGIVKGKWNRKVVSLFKKEKITADFSQRPFEPIGDTVKYNLTSLPMIGKIFKQYYRLQYKIKTLFSQEN